MNLIHDTGEYASWLWRATQRLAQVNRGAAVRLIASTSINQVVTFLVFFLPLKVVLLVASDGVSRYFQFFITQKTKSTWIVGLVAAILVFYVVSIRLDTVADRNASRGAKSLVSNAEQVPVTSDPEDFARSVFYRIGETVGGLIFSTLTLVAGAVVFPAFFLAIPVLLLVEFGAVAASLSETPPVRLGSLGAFVAKNPQDFIKWLRQINFLIVFSILIVLFLTLEGLNPLLGIAAILLSRRLFGALRKVVRDTLKLSSDRRFVDALLFPEARVRVSAAPDREQLLGTALSSARRLEEFRGLTGPTAKDKEVAWYTDDPSTLELLQSVEDDVWVDSGQTRTAIFDLYGAGVDGSPERLFREYLYSGKASRGLEQHDYLLRFFDTGALRSPGTVLEYRHHGLVGRIVDFRGVNDFDERRWQVRRRELLEHLWALELPTALIEAYESVHPHFHEQLLDDFLAPLRVAADERWAKSAYELLTSRLPELCEDVAELPLMLFNERLTQRNVLVGSDGCALLLDWTSWSLQPVGSGFNSDVDDRELLERIAKSANRRGGPARSVRAEQLFLASILQRMNRWAHAGFPKYSLRIAFSMTQFLDNPDAEALEQVLSKGGGTAVVG